MLWDAHTPDAQFCLLGCNASLCSAWRICLHMRLCLLPAPGKGWIPFLGPWGLISSSSGEWELHQGALQAAPSTACSFVGEDQSRWSFDDPTIKLVPASLPALLSWIACMGIPRCPSSHSPQSEAGSLWWWRLRTVPGCRAAVGQWGCSIKWVMLGLWPTGGYIHLAPVQALGLRAW